MLENGGRKTGSRSENVCSLHVCGIESGLLLSRWGRKSVLVKLNLMTQDVWFVTCKCGRIGIDILRNKLYIMENMSSIWKPCLQRKSYHLMVSTLGLRYMVVLPQPEKDQGTLPGLPLSTFLSSKPVEPVESLAGMCMHNYNDII